MLAYEEADIVRSFLHCEGGSLACDGDGTLIATETSLLHPNRNPGLSKAWVEQELLRMLGLEKVVWLPGDPLDLETDGHVDGMCCFVRPGVVMFEYNPDPMDLHGRILGRQVAREDGGLSLDLARRLLCDVAVDVVDEHARSVLGEKLGGRAADTVRRAGDDRRLALEHAHCFSLSQI